MVALLALLSTVGAPIPREPLPDPKSPGYIGVEFHEVADGIQLSRIYGDSPAERAELQVGDTITSFDGQPMGNIPSVQLLIVHTAPNTPVPIVVLRGDRKIAMKLRVGHRPDDFPFRPPVDPDDGGNDN